jgi:hypothetical protein
VTVRAKRLTVSFAMYFAAMGCVLAGASSARADFRTGNTWMPSPPWRFPVRNRTGR